MDFIDDTDRISRLSGEQMTASLKVFSLTKFILSPEDTFHLESAVGKVSSQTQALQVKLEALKKAQEAQATKLIGQVTLKSPSQQLLGAIEATNKIFLLRLFQTQMLQFVAVKQSSADFKSIYSNSFSTQLRQMMIPLSRLPTTINFKMVSNVLGFESQLLEQLAKLLNKPQLSSKEPKQKGKAINQLKIINSKLVTVTDVFPFACVRQIDDLMSQDSSNQRWKTLFGNKWIETRLYGDVKDVRKSFDETRFNINRVAAMLLLNEQAKESETSGLKHVLGSMQRLFKIAFDQSEAQHEAEVMISMPKEGLARKMWNLPDQEAVQPLIKPWLPIIAFSELFYVSRNLPQGPVTNEQIRLMEVRRPYSEAIQIRINYNHQLFKVEDIGSFTYIVNQKMEDMKGFFSKGGPAKPKGLIYHIHGGGFISMSSFIHQMYSRIWSKQIDVPIVSVDYGKAPEHPFPEGLNDCVTVYKWVVQRFCKIFNYTPERVVIVGDSAGGNLAAALTNKIIQLGLPGPCGQVLVYPALNLNYFEYTPSLLHALNDTILPHTFLKLCLQAYLKGGFDATNDYFISPIVTPDRILAQYPPTSIFVGDKDPFHDDCCRLTERIKYNGGIDRQIGDHTRW